MSDGDAQTGPNRTLRRLQWLAERHSDTAVRGCVLALTEALGIHEHHSELSKIDDLDVLVNRAAEILPPYTRFGRHLPWLARELEKALQMLLNGKTALDRLGGAREAYADGSRLIYGFRPIVDWAQATHVDLSHYDGAGALASAGDWRAAKALAKMLQGEVIYTFDDGWTVQQLSTLEQIRAEGDAMQSCLSDASRVPTSELYSLRDPSGHPHATLDWHPHEHRVAQLRGKQNIWPSDPYLLRMVEFRVKKIDPPDDYRRSHPVLHGGNHNIPDPYIGTYLCPSIGESPAVDTCIYVLMTGPTNRGPMGFIFPKSELKHFSEISEPGSLSIVDASGDSIYGGMNASGESIYRGGLGFSWRVFLDHRVVMEQSHPLWLEAGKMVEDEMVAAIADARHNDSALDERIDALLPARISASKTGPHCKSIES